MITRLLPEDGQRLERPPLSHQHPMGGEVAKSRNIKYISAYIFSTENWSRTKEEVSYLMDLFLYSFKHDMKQLARDGFRIVFLNRREHLSAKILRAMDETEADSQDNTGPTLALCFNYGGQAEIVDAAAKLAKSGDDFTEENFAKYLYHPEIPPIDILVRSSGEQRLSGFMLWRAAYAELMWIDKMWPDMTEADFDDVLTEFAKRSRRFGK
jgi:undecaprenyl diphosphate synthase